MAAFWGAAVHAHPDQGSHSAPPWQRATGWPDRIITTFADDPATTITVSWRTDASVGRTIAQIAPATADTRFDLAAQTWRARTRIVDLEVLQTPVGVRHSPENVGLGEVAYHEIVFKDLEPGRLYAWRVQGARGQWSPWHQTRTAPISGPIRFVYFGDAQNGIYSHWSRVIRMAHEVAPGADFFLHAGDLVQQGDSDYNWAEWFFAGGFIHARTPSIVAPGNHENISVWPEDPDAALNRDVAEGPKTRVRTPLWRAQFALPVDKTLPPALHEQAYMVRYTDDLHVFVVDSAHASFAEQAAWLDTQLAQSDARWRVVTMHHPYFVPAAFDRNPTDAARRDAFAPVIEKHKVDLVLTGHIHTYARSSAVSEENGAAGAEGGRAAAGTGRQVDTVFMISASGAKNSDLFDRLAVTDAVGDGQPDLDTLSLDRVAGNTPMFQVFDVDGDTIRYEARTATGALYDAFTLTKAEDGTKALESGDAARGDTRLFSNTGPYREWWDLR